MSKVFLNAKLVSDDDNLNIEIYGIKTDNKIVYKENNITVTILILNNKIEMNRVCNEYEIKLIFEKGKNTESNYSLFGTSKIFKLNTYTQLLEIEDNKLNINYNLEGNNYSYCLKWRD